MVKWLLSVFFFARERAFFHQRFTPSFYFSVEQGRTHGGEWRRERGKRPGEGGDPSCVVLPESSVNLVGWGVALCVVWLRCLTSRGDVPGEGSQSSRRLEDSVCTCEQRVELLARSTSIREPPREILKVVVNCIPHFLLRRSWIFSGKRRCHSRIQLHFVKRSYYISWW